MTDKAMPERIYLRRGNRQYHARVNQQEGMVLYVRADHVQGDANEPLADGQWRWTKSHIYEAWTPREISEWGGEMFVRFTDGRLLDPSKFESIGPVIQPLENM